MESASHLDKYDAIFSPEPPIAAPEPERVIEPNGSTHGGPESPTTPPEAIKKYVAQAQVYVCPDRVPVDCTVGMRVFLAGTIEQNNSPNWQREAILDMAHLPISIFNPRRDDWNTKWPPRAQFPQFNEQVNWELGLIESCDVVMMYLHPETRSPISLLELGILARWHDPGPDEDEPVHYPEDAAWKLPSYELDPALTQIKPLKKKFIVCCPEEYERVGNVEATCHRYRVPMVKTYREFINLAIRMITGKDAPPKRVIPEIDQWRGENGKWRMGDKPMRDPPRLKWTEKPTKCPQYEDPEEAAA